MAYSTTSPSTTIGSGRAGTAQAGAALIPTRSNNNALQTPQSLKV